jgi:rod shape-determining protein MreD
LLRVIQLESPVRFFALLGFVYLAAVLETSLVDVMRIGPIAPDLLALAAIVWVLTVPGRWTFLAAGAIGLLSDLAAPGHLGVGMAWMLLVGYAVGRLRMGRNLDALPWQLPVAWAAVTVWAAAVGLTGRILGDLPLPWSVILTRSAEVGLYTAGVALPVLMVLGWTREPLRKGV